VNEWFYKVFGVCGQTVTNAARMIAQKRSKAKKNRSFLSNFAAPGFSLFRPKWELSADGSQGHSRRGRRTL
jgi:hypothetical protein